MFYNFGMPYVLQLVSFLDAIFCLCMNEIDEKLWTKRSSDVTKEGMAASTELLHEKICFCELHAACAMFY